MTGETKASINGWTVDTLRTHVLSIIEAHDKRYEERYTSQTQALNAALASVKEATLKAEESQQRVNIGQNEFRGALKDYTERLASKESLASIDARVAALEISRASIQGKTYITSILWAAGTSVMTAWVVTHWIK